MIVLCFCPAASVSKLHTRRQCPKGEQMKIKHIYISSKLFLSSEKIILTIDYAKYSIFAASPRPKWCWAEHLWDMKSRKCQKNQRTVCFRCIHTPGNTLLGFDLRGCSPDAVHSTFEVKVWKVKDRLFSNLAGVISVLTCTAAGPKFRPAVHMWRHLQPFLTLFLHLKAEPAHSSHSFKFQLQISVQPFILTKIFTPPSNL